MVDVTKSDQLPGPAPTARTFTRDDVAIGVLDWGGVGDPVVLLHPNGFCAGVFHPLARRLVTQAQVRVVGIDLRGHGASRAPNDRHRYLWADLGLDVLHALDQLGIGSAYAMGESLGGGIAVAVDQLRPGVWRRLMLCEAVAIKPRADVVVGQRAPEADETTGTNPFDLPAMARRRRPWFPSRADMVAAYAKRPPLGDMEHEALAAYAQWGTRDRPDGTVELACEPEVEAILFEGPAQRDHEPTAWQQLARLNCPATVLAGRSSYLPNEWFRAQAEEIGCSFHLIDGGHFFVQEDGDRAAALVAEHLLS